MCIRDSITIGQYIPGESFIHKLDPRTKILISFLFIISLFIVDKFVGYIFVVAFLALVVYIAKISPRYLYKGLKPVFLLIALTAILKIFMLREGRLIFHIGFIKIYESGIRTAVFMAIRLILLIMGTSVLTLTTSPIELTDGIERLLKPIGKEIAHELAMMMTIALRFIPTLIDETDKIMKAQDVYKRQYIYGVGLSTSQKILATTGINPDTRIKDLTEDEVNEIRNYVNKNLMVEGDLRRDVALNIKRLVEIGCYSCLLYTSRCV